MRLSVPAVRSVDVRHRTGSIGQLMVPERELEGDWTRFVVPSMAGHRLSKADGEVLYVFPKSPRPDHVPTDGIVLVGPIPAELNGFVDLRASKWLVHPAINDAHAGAARAHESWSHAFSYVGEDEVGAGRIGLRRPQLGALHSIHAHWSTSKEVATIVMPTGTGKTETMLATLVSARCVRVLVLVPTDALRTQIAQKFFTMGILKDPRASILQPGVRRPVVGTLTKRPATTDEVEELFLQCNVVVTTSALAGGCLPEVQVRMAELCSHLFIDEAHHAEATTWKQFKSHFKGRSQILQFTATPFREDGQPLDGKIIYVYPMRQAQSEGYFRPIRFSSVYAFNSARADRDIAAKVIEELHADVTGLHVAMARVSTRARATEVHSIYEVLGQFNPVIIHSGLKETVIDAARKKLESGESRIVICVDMLGEGFDMPELKIAAFHDLRKSLAITLQLAGRFTRARSDLGEPVFIANTADVNLKDELRALYSQDPDWNLLLPHLSEGAIGQELEAQRFIGGFVGQLDEIPLTEIQPAASMVVYRTQCRNWTPEKYQVAFKGGSDAEKVYPILNEAERMLVVIAARRQGVPWTGIATVDGIAWELCIAIWDRDKALLYIHGSANNGNYSDFAKALCGDNVELIKAPNVFRVFYGINRLMLTNVGLDEQLGRQIRYTGRMGPDVGALLAEATLATTSKAVLAGVGFERGGPASVGAGKRGRVWSNLRLRVDQFAAWCRNIGAKIDDPDIDPEEVLRGTLIPSLIDSRPAAVPVAVDWPLEILDFVESATTVSFQTTVSRHLTYVSIEPRDYTASGAIVLKIGCDQHEVQVRLVFIGQGKSADFAYVYEGDGRATIKRGAEHDLCEFLTKHPPTIWFADGSRLDGNVLVQLRTRVSLFSRDRLVALDWTNIDLTQESQREERRSDSVQFRMIEHIKMEARHDILFDDDGKGEAADIVGVSLDNPTLPRLITVDLYHCKYSSAPEAGARIGDMYEVCGQSQRSVLWLHNKDRRTDLFAHLLKREALRTESGRATRFEIGSKERLIQIRDLSRTCKVAIHVFIVQPGLSKAQAAEHQLAVLGVTEKFLQETYQIPLLVYCS
jgi:superfamily II DNA or RNA helicase